MTRADTPPGIQMSTETSVTLNARPTRGHGVGLIGRCVVVDEAQPPVTPVANFGRLRLAGDAGCGQIFIMVEGSDSGNDEPTGWALIRELVWDIVENWRHPRSSTVRYIRCDGCGQVTPHSSDTRIVGLWSGEVMATPPEAVCDFCEHAQPRAVGDEVPADITVMCTGRRYGGVGRRRSVRACGRAFAAPAAAPRVQCPWCGTVQLRRRGR